MLGFAASEARAGLVITLGNATVASGGTATIDISVFSTTGTDFLSSFNLGLLITPVGTPAGLLQFSSTQPDFSGNPDYVFYQQSGLGAAFWGPPYMTNYTADSITGGDVPTSNAVLISATGTGPFSLLAQVQFDPLIGDNGDTFQVSLITDPNFTSFSDPNGGELPYISIPGSVMIGSAVPEPSSMTLAALSSLGGLLLFWRRRRQG